MTVTINEEKVWGTVSHLIHPKAMSSILSVKEGFRCSNHRHLHRWNRFHVISGEIHVYRVEIVSGKAITLQGFALRAGDTEDVAPWDWHRFDVIQSGVIIESYWTEDGHDVSVDDIERIDVGGPIEPC